MSDARAAALSQVLELYREVDREVAVASTSKERVLEVLARRTGKTAASPNAALVALAAKQNSQQCIWIASGPAKAFNGKLLSVGGGVTLPLGVACRVVSGSRQRLVIEESAVA